MPGLTQTRDAALALLKTALPSIRRIEAFSGNLTFESASLKNLPPEAVFVAVLDAGNAAEPASLDFDMLATFSAFILTRNRRDRESREADSLMIAEAVAQILHGATYGLPGVSPARVLTLAPVTDSELEQQGMCVWFVVWQHKLVFTLPMLPEEKEIHEPA